MGNDGAHACARTACRVVRLGAGAVPLNHNNDFRAHLRRLANEADGVICRAEFRQRGKQAAKHLRVALLEWPGLPIG